jgi:small-conductance mechanosensitive channel
VQIRPPQQMDFLFFSLNFFEKLKGESNFEKIINLIVERKEFIYEAFLLAIFLVIFYFLINFIFINPLYKILTQNKKANTDRLKTIIKSFKNLISVLVLIIFVIFLFSKLGIKINTLLTSAGILGAALLVVFQNSIRDFLSGWFFVIEDTFREGEYIIVNNTFKGRVYNLRSRYLVLRGDNGELIMIPYGQINFVHNFSRKRIINKLTLKVRKENYNEKNINALQNFLKDLSDGAQEIGEPEIIDINEVGESYIEILVKFKTPFYLSVPTKTKVKKEILNKFNDIILEIKDAS